MKDLNDFCKFYEMDKPKCPGCESSDLQSVMWRKNTNIAALYRDDKACHYCSNRNPSNNLGYFKCKDADCGHVICIDCILIGKV